MTQSLDYRYCVYYDGDLVALCNNKAEARCIGEAQNDDTYIVVELPAYRTLFIDVPDALIPEVKENE
jgi:hypothetical protein